MKIEKLTENKIRVVVNSSDFKFDNLNLDNFKQTFIINLLERAKKEVGFETDGYKLLIETYSSNDDFIAFIITKYFSLEKKIPVVKRKLPKLNENNFLYKFDSFKEFCEFCNCINKTKNFNIKNLSKNINLYNYKNTYYLLLNNINNCCINKITLFSILSEFSKPLKFSNTFENKLIEYGNLIIEKNTVEQALRYFL